MTRLRFLTAGESHGKALIGILEGMPSGVSVSESGIDKELRRRQAGYGRGGRMKIETDHAEIISGVRWGKTLGSPISLMIENRDWKNWEKGMSASAQYEGSIDAVVRPRPGHADLTGGLKYGHKDVRNILERSSARETAMRVGLGGLAKMFLSCFGITVGSYVLQIGGGAFEPKGKKTDPRELAGLFNKAEKSEVRCPDPKASADMMKSIDVAIKEGYSLGGIFEVFICGAPPGLGSHIQWDTRIEGRLSQAVMGIQAIKGVEIGAGFETGKKPGHEVMDEIFYDRRKSSYYRKTNNAGGIEGGMTNGMPIILKAVMKPIPTLRRPLRSVDIISRNPFRAAYERSDTCAVPAAAVVAEAMCALVVADAFLEKFGGDSLDEVRRNYDSYLAYLKSY